MIAKLTLLGGKQLVLDDAGRWLCPADPALADDLNDGKDSPRENYSPADGYFQPYAAGVASEVAERLQAEIEVMPWTKPPPPHGGEVIY